ncbi:MAG: DUF2080 family transposase-associated protein, partial [Methanomicrobiales archaeon]
VYNYIYLLIQCIVIMDARQITINGYEMIEKTAGKSGNSGYLYIPAKWAGKRVAAILLEPIEPTGGE